MSTSFIVTSHHFWRSNRHHCGTGVSLLERLSFMLSFGCYLAASPGHAAAEKNGETTIPFQGRVLLKLHTPRN